MMAAMMFPSIAPMVVMYARIQDGKRERGQEAAIGATALFVLGYLVTWTAAGLLGYAIFELGPLARSTRSSPGTRAVRYVAGGRHPRRRDLPADAAQGRLPAQVPEPARVRAHRLAAGPARRAADGDRARRLVRRLLLGADGGAVRARRDEHRLDGLHRGADRDREAAAVEAARESRRSRSLLAVLGLAVAFAPEDVPGLTIPDSPEAAQAMEAMGMEGETEMETEGTGGAGATTEDDSMGGGAPRWRTGCPAPGWRTSSA